MRRRDLFRLAGLAAVAACLPAAVTAEPLFVIDTNDGYLNLRTGPGTGYGIVIRLTAGIEVQAGAAQGSWRQVVLPDGTAGWASARYLAPWYNPARRYDYRVVRTNDGHLNLRTGPGTGHGILRRLYAGQRVFALEWAGSWVRIQLPDGTTGWASGNFLAPV